MGDNMIGETLYIIAFEYLDQVFAKLMHGAV